MVVQIAKKCKFYSNKKYSKIDFFKKEFWHISHYKKMHMFQAFYDFYDIVFVVEVSIR